MASVRRHASAIDALLNGNVAPMMVIARASAQLGDTAEAIEVLKEVVSMGIVRNLSGDNDLTPLHTSKEWASLIATNESNIKPIGSARPLFAMPGLDFLAEDIVWDGAGKRYLVSSVRKVGDSFHFIANAGWDGFGADGALRKDHGLTPPAVLSIKLK